GRAARVVCGRADGTRRHRDRRDRVVPAGGGRRGRRPRERPQADRAGLPPPRLDGRLTADQVVRLTAISQPWTSGAARVPSGLPARWPNSTLAKFRVTWSSGLASVGPPSWKLEMSTSLNLSVMNSSCSLPARRQVRVADLMCRPDAQASMRFGEAFETREVKWKSWKAALPAPPPLPAAPARPVLLRP